MNRILAQLVLPVAATLLMVTDGGRAEPHLAQTNPAVDPAVAPTATEVMSYWGPLPAASDSVSARFTNHPRPGWEYIFLAPYTIIKIPFWAVGTGLLYTTQFLYDQKAVRTLAKGLTGFRGPWGGWINTSVSVGGLDGFGFGFNYNHEQVGGKPDNLANLRLKWSLYGNQKYTLGMIFNSEGRNVVQLGAGYRLRTNARYFGLGPDAQVGDESWYSEEKIWAGLGMAHRFGSALAISVAAIYSHLDNAEPNEKLTPSTTDRFTGRLPFGWGMATEGIDWTFTLRHDNTSETGRPERGGIRRIKATYFSSSDGSGLEYWDYRLELEQFVPLWFRSRALALRAYVSWIDDVSGDDVHFQRLLINDDPDKFRGYNDFRWRDRGITAFTAEYRWPVWLLAEPRGPGMDAYLFTDIGQVFDEFEQIKGGNLTTSYGGGFRFIGRDGRFSTRLEIGVSEEDVVFRLTGEQIFQFVKGGVYYGRDPVPAR